LDKKVDYKYRVKLTPKAEKFLDSLVDDQKLSLIGLIGMLRKLGYELEYPYSKKVHTKKNRIYELRCNKFGNRLYYFFHEENIYIATNGGGKSTQPKDIKQADKMASDIKSKM
jgi:hypothetical protein